MSVPDLIPVGTRVRVRGALAPAYVCQVIDIHVDKRRGEVLYALGEFVARGGLLKRWPKKRSWHHWVGPGVLEVVTDEV